MHTDSYLSLLRYLLGINMVSQVRSEVAVGVGQRVLDLFQRLVILLGPLDALLQLLLPERRLRKQETHHTLSKNTHTLMHKIDYKYSKQLTGNTSVDVIVRFDIQFSSSCI